jgi:hypothetical protein
MPQRLLKAENKAMLVWLVAEGRKVENRNFTWNQRVLNSNLWRETSASICLRYIRACDSDFLLAQTHEMKCLPVVSCRPVTFVSRFSSVENWTSEIKPQKSQKYPGLHSNTATFYACPHRHNSCISWGRLHFITLYNMFLSYFIWQSSWILQFPCIHQCL